MGQLVYDKDDDIVRCMRSACRMATTIVANSANLMVISITVQYAYVHACYVTRIVLLLLRNVTVLMNIVQNTRAWLIFAKTSFMKQFSK